MSRPSGFLPLACLILLAISLGCASRPGAQDEPTRLAQVTIEGVVTTGQSEERCPLPPQGFSEADLTGEWTAGFGEETDVLTIRSDGTYRQRTTIEALNYDEESDWQQWRIEYSDTGIPYLHLSDLQLCVSYHLDSCQSRGGGELGWWDFCRERVVRMPDEGILIVMGVPEGFVAPPRGIQLVPLSRDPDSSGLAYFLQE